MGDTKRGREHKGRVKERQRVERQVELELEHRDEDVDFEELYPEESEALADD